MQALIALGSNLGSRRATLDRAAAELNRLPQTRVLKRSTWFETPPESPGDGGAYLNGAALVETRLRPEELLEELLVLERRFGRTRRQRARTLDLDLILWGQERRRSRTLTLPHPRFRGRAFVLEPGAAVAAGLRDPESGQTLAELWGQWGAR